MAIGSVFVKNGSQAVQLPWDVRLPDGVHQVEIRVRCNELIITPLGQLWHSFIMSGPCVTGDFLPERAPATPGAATTEACRCTRHYLWPKASRSLG